MGVLVGVNTCVFVAVGWGVAVGFGVLVGITGVGEAKLATSVNLAATVSAAWVKAASGEVGEVGAAIPPGRLQLTKTMTKNNVRLQYIFFIVHLLNISLMNYRQEVNSTDVFICFNVPSKKTSGQITGC
jgi:nitrate/nitrite transporter NarK